MDGSALQHAWPQCRSLPPFLTLLLLLLSIIIIILLIFLLLHHLLLAPLTHELATLSRAGRWVAEMGGGSASELL